MYLNYQQVSILLAIKRNTLYSMVHRNQIPHYRLGPRMVRFSETELLQWLQERHVKQHHSVNLNGGEL